MIIGAVTIDPFSLSDAAGLLAGLLVLGVLVACIAICAEDSPISDFLRASAAPQRTPIPLAKHAVSAVTVERVMATDASLAAFQPPATGKDLTRGPE